MSGLAAEAAASAAAASSGDVDDRLTAMRERIETLKASVDMMRSSRATGDLSSTAKTVGATAPFPFSRMQVRRHLSGHFGKVYAVDWANDSVSLVTASQDGTLMLWNGKSGLKTSCACWLIRLDEAGDEPLTLVLWQLWPSSLRG